MKYAAEVPIENENRNRGLVRKYVDWHLLFLDSLYRKLTVRANGEIFCFLFNLRARIRKKSVRFEYVKAENIYKANSGTYVRYFSTKSQNYISYSDGIAQRGISLGQTYFCHQIRFDPNDVIVDCGANVGDLKIWFEENGLTVDYTGFEPSPKEYECLVRNVGSSDARQIGLWNEDANLVLYVSSDNADSSFFRPPKYTEEVSVQAERLDSIFSKRIRLLKIEAEGAEPEVLQGCAKLLSRVDYIAADLGFERGESQESTLAPVTNFLLANDFELINFSVPRVVALYKRRGI